MKRNLFLSVAVLVVSLSSNSFAQKASEVQVAAAAKPAAAQKSKPQSSVDGRGAFLKSHVKSIGHVGRYEVVSVKIRGLDTPNLAGFFLLDSASGEIVGAQTGTAPGLGVAIVNGAASAGGSFLFGTNLRPARTSISNGASSGAITAGSTSSATATTTGGNNSATGGSSSSNATGGNSNSSATGGNSSSDATGGNGNGGSGSGGFTPPGHDGEHGNPHN